MWKIAGTVLNIVLAAVNIALFFLWWSLVRKEAGAPPPDRTYVLDNVAFSVSVLEVLIAAVGIGLALLGIFGFAEIRNSAELRAETTAKETAAKVASDEAKKAIEQFKADMREAQQFSSQPSIAPQTAETARAVREGEDE